MSLYIHVHTLPCGTPESTLANKDDLSSMTLCLQPFNYFSYLIYMYIEFFIYNI